MPDPIKITPKMIDAAQAVFPRLTREEIVRVFETVAATVGLKTCPEVKGYQTHDGESRDSCPNMKCTYEGMDGERYRCEVCGDSYWLDYDEMR